MASTQADGSEDVNDFLQRIKELRDTQDQEDEERNRKLEEDILQGRKERQARRAERARSISPTKSSPANTPIASRQAATQSSSLSETLSPVIDPHKGSDVRRDNAIDDAMDRLTGSPTKEISAPIVDGEQSTADVKRASPINASPSSAMPSRNSPLSWQRRPNSQASERPRSRPLSMVATENAARSPRATPEPLSEFVADPILSRDQIAQSLASKDPAWFRQSADSRGGTSPAYRKNQVEDQDRSDHGSNSARVQMPGMSSEPSRSDQGPEGPVDRLSSPSMSSAGSGGGFGSRSSGIGSPVPLTSAQRFDPPNPDSLGEVRGLAMSPSQGRISPDRLDRPASPTKGMGGFVQSAMMKRSDSVSKRWSVQSPPGLKRGDSVASNRSSQEPTALANIVNASLGSSRPSSLSRDNSPRPLSRPTSSHSNTTITQDGRPGTSNSMRSSMTAPTTNDGFVKPSLPASRSQTPQNMKPKQETLSLEGATTPPSSPSKTMDTKRWSPTKSSWLESALNKPESPKPKPAPPPQQPAWMSEINKAKQKGSIDLSRDSTASHKHEVSIGGLMRSPPPGGLAKPISIGGLPAGFASGATSKVRSENISSQTTTTAASKEEPIEATSAFPATNIRSPAISKIKPETPPKKDFRANLKPRQLPLDSGKEEPEFKNVFGQLKRTKTQNYVAPDELKNNITRGKAALNLTGGPKRTERKDEFKDAILKKKEDFKKAQQEGKGVTRSTIGGLQETTLPEALAKRKALGRPDPTTEVPSFQETAKPSFSSKENDTSGRLQGRDATGSKLAGRFNPALAGLLARGPPSIASDTSRSDSPVSSRTVSMSTSTTNDTSEPGPQLTHMTKGRARGPRRKAPSAVIASTTDPVEASESKTAGQKPEASVKSPNTATLMRTQKSIGSTSDSSSRNDSENPTSQPSSPRKLDLKRRSQFLQEASNKISEGEPQLNAPRPLSPTKKAVTVEQYLEAKEAITPVSSPTIKTKPEAPIKSPSLTSKTRDRTTGTQGVDPSETINVKPLSPTKANTEPINGSANIEMRAVSSQNSPTQFRGRNVADAEVPTPVSVRNVAAIWDRPATNQTPANPPRSRSPIKLPTHEDEKAAMVGAGLRSASPVKGKAAVGLNLQTSSDFGSARPLPTPPSKGPLSPPSNVGLITSATATESNYSPVPQTSEASRLVEEFFGQRHSPPPDFVADTAALLAARKNEGQSVKTLRSSLYQFYNDGKKQLVPSHQERLLFEENMYICVHTFGTAVGKKVTEVYLWVGDEVPTTAATGSDVFAQREAKAAGGTLIKIRQGKEPAEFFQALGGIIIIRRGSSNKYDSLAPHILCGRKHFGQIAFDEVDYSTASLCSGFPYLISTQAGKSYLWKGKGSGIDELSCARLIGMDFGLTGEIEEVDDGNESSSFLQIFGSGSKIPISADHWRMKPNYSKYCGRLFCADSASKSQVVEISPFNQSDISQSNIYILDAFFEIYIIVGCRAQTQFASFSNALMFAQEYGILAAGLEDRPYVPVTTVVLEGIPKDMKSVFRKWSDELTPTIVRPLSPGLQRGRSLRVVPLTAALEATRRP